MGNCLEGGAIVVGLSKTAKSPKKTLSYDLAAIQYKHGTKRLSQSLMLCTKQSFEMIFDNLVQLVVKKILTAH